jgi:hypothetical protein
VFSEGSSIGTACRPLAPKYRPQTRPVLARSGIRQPRRRVDYEVMAAELGSGSAVSPKPGFGGCGKAVILWDFWSVCANSPIIATLAVMLSVAAAVPAFANSAVGANPDGNSTYSAAAGAGGR